MKLSVIVLAVSTAVNTVAAKVSSYVVVPALRKAADLKAKGLELAHNEAENVYWKHVDTHSALSAELKRVEQKMKTAAREANLASREVRSYAKERLV